MRSSFGVYLGEGTTSVARVEAGREGRRVSALRSAAVPVDRSWPPGDLGEITSMLRDLGFGAQEVHVALPSSACFFHGHTSALTDEEQIRRTLESQVEDYLPLPVEELVVDFAPAGTAEEATRILAVACRRELLRDVLGALEGRGIAPVTVGVDVFGLLECLRSCGQEGDDSVIVHFGRRSFCVALCGGGRILGARNVMRHGGLTDVARLASKVAQEIRLSLLEAGGGFAPQAIHVSGEGAETAAEVVPPLSTLVHCPVRLLSEELSQCGMFAQQGSFDPGAPVAVGAALRAFDSAGGVDFRRGEFRYRGRLERVAAPLAAALVTAALLLGILAAGAFRDGVRARRQIEETEVLRQSIWRELFPGRPAPVGMERVLRSELERLSEKQSTGKPGPEPLSALEALRDVVRCLPEPTGQAAYVLERVDIDQEGFRCRGTADSYAAASAVQLALSRAPNWEVRIESMQAVGGGSPRSQVSFALRATRFSGPAAGEAQERQP